MRHRYSKKRPTDVAMNITAFMNLMVILVPFLLMTAVFNHLTILELNLPTAKAGKSGGKKPVFDLKVLIRSNDILVSNGRRIIQKIDHYKGEHNYKYLSQVIQQVKARNPDKKAVTILSQQTTPYNDLIQVMDAVRSFHTLQEGSVIEAELFPDISIGDAPR